LVSYFADYVACYNDLVIFCYIDSVIFLISLKSFTWFAQSFFIFLIIFEILSIFFFYFIIPPYGDSNIFMIMLIIFEILLVIFMILLDIIEISLNNFKVYSIIPIIFIR
jgi:hypothetical protein